MKTSKILDSLLEQCDACSGDAYIPPSTKIAKHDDASMAISDLSNLIENAQKLHDMIPEDYPLEDWAEAKITKATDYINSVLKYISYDVEGQGEAPTDSPVAIYISTSPNMMKESGDYYTDKLQYITNISSKIHAVDIDEETGSIVLEFETKDGYGYYIKYNAKTEQYEDITISEPGQSNYNKEMSEDEFMQTEIASEVDNEVDNLSQYVYEV
jgi:hypothetical protein